MTNPEKASGVDDENEPQVARTDFREYLAKYGILAIQLGVMELRTIGGNHPEYLNIPTRVSKLQELYALAELDLQEAGYTSEEIRRLSISFQAPHDPRKPRTNR
jgi:hypothetical protein